MSPTKRCSECRTVKPLGEFARDASKRSGYGALCRACDSARGKARYAANREAQLAKANARAGQRRSRRRRPVTP
jgi:hypothetical protein